MASSIATVQSDDRNANQSQSNILTTLNNLLRTNALISGSLLTNSSSLVGNAANTDGIPLVAGDNTINHGLGRALIGWIVVRSSAAATIYDKQSTNIVNGQSQAGLTLILNASAPTTVYLYVF